MNKHIILSLHLQNIKLLKKIDHIKNNKHISVSQQSSKNNLTTILNK